MSASRERRRSTGTKARARNDSAAGRRRFRNMQKRMGTGAAYTASRVEPGAAYEVIDPQDVFDRDDWRCKICGQPVDRRARFPHPQSPTLDHIVPLAHGGDHSVRNVRCAHLRCNQQKADAAPRGSSRTASLLGFHCVAGGFGGPDFGKSLRHIESRWDVAEALIEQNEAALGRRKLDRFMLAVVHVAVCAASVTANERTRIEECGTLSCQGMLWYCLGVNANGSVVRVAREILTRMGLIRCIDTSCVPRSREHPGQCQRWVPAGASWSLPFLRRMADSRLTLAQRIERTVYLAALATREEREEARQRREDELTRARRTLGTSPDEGTTEPAQAWVEGQRGQLAGGGAVGAAANAKSARSRVARRGGTAHPDDPYERIASVPVMIAPPWNDNLPWEEAEALALASSGCCLRDFDGNICYLEHLCLGEDYTDLLGVRHRAWVPEPDEEDGDDRRTVPPPQGGYVDNPYGDGLISLRELYGQPW